MNQKISTKRIAMTGLLAALTAVGSGLRIVIPVSIGGNSAFHLGNIFCALSGVLLGPGLGGLAAGLGSAIFDMTNPIYISECWLTFLMKGAYGLTVGLAARHLKCSTYLRDLLSTVAGAVTYALLYLGKNFLEALIVTGVNASGAMVAVVSRLPATTFNAAVAIIIAPVLASAIRRALALNHIKLD